MRHTAAPDSTRQEIAAALPYVSLCRVPSRPRIMAVKNRRQNRSVEVVDAKIAVDLATAQTYSENVFLFVPNLIGMKSAMRYWAS